MSRRFVLGFFASLAVLIIPLVLLSRTAEKDPVRSRVAGDVEEVVGGLAADELPAFARGFLATDRPWRAARTMDRYLEQTTDPPADHLVLAARAHGGWGGWPEALRLMQGIPSLESHDNGIGLYLLARARDEQGDARRAVEAYRAFLAFSPPAGALQAEREAARLRLGLALIRAGDAPGGRGELAALDVTGSPWFQLLEAEALAAAGDTAAVGRAVSGFDSGMLGLRGWRARVEAARRAGDLAGARALANRARGWAGTDDTRAEFLLLAGRIAGEMGDRAAARDAFRGVIDLSAAGAHAREAGALLAEGDMTPEDHLAVARVQAAQGLHDEAVAGFRRWLSAGRGTGSQRAAVHMEHATALFYAERYDQVGDALGPIAGQTLARHLLARAEAHRGRTAAAVRLYRGSGTGSEGLFLAAGTYHDAGERDEARALYQEVVRRYPGSDRMGHALMRLAGMAYDEGDHAGAARLWDQYRSRYARGDRVLQATYWAGRARAEMGDSAGAAALFRDVLGRERDSYYALVASEKLGQPFWPLPMEASPAGSAEADRLVAGWMRELDLLREAGFAEAAGALASEIAGRAGTDRPTRYALAEALAERGYSQRAILLGIGLQGSGPPNPRLLRILYPFPYRTLITEEARDRGLDPFIAAALIRQESMFEVRITSPAGARGLMQIMPATGARVADAAGMDHWDAELLYHPEINVHLGVRYVAQQMETYEGSLPSVFSAYNAGPHRVERWSAFPEYGDDELFTERIPFRETRDYVKILTRNRALYEGLYGDS
ncbi:MAG TPA: transglycosylase SLT domain-containing protein [Longimicrobiales bacterium]|nr:transglycosylase SLT domain-containing protein [Longimicrobiales bacterium]